VTAGQGAVTRRRIAIWPDPAGKIEPMATAVKKLDLEVGELVEVGGRRYEVVPDRAGGLTLEQRITPVSELYAGRGWKPASEEDFERLTAADAPPDGEG
jgi:hypothetical protein